MMSGRAVNPTVVYPSYGSIVSHQRGFKTKLPPFVQIGGAVDHASAGGGTAGYLGPAPNPFELLSDPNATPFKGRDITPPEGDDRRRVARRRSLLGAVAGLQRQNQVPA